MKKTITKRFVLPQPYEVLLGYIQDTYLRSQYRIMLKKQLQSVVSQREWVSFYETCLEKGERYMSVDEFRDEEIEEEFIKYEEEEGYKSFNKSVRYLNTCIKQEKRLQHQYEIQLEGLERKIFGVIEHQLQQVLVKFDLYKKGSLVGGVI